MHINKYCSFLSLSSFSGTLIMQMFAYLMLSKRSFNLSSCFKFFSLCCSPCVLGDMIQVLANAMVSFLQYIPLWNQEVLYSNLHSNVCQLYLKNARKKPLKKIILHFSTFDPNLVVLVPFLNNSNYTLTIRGFLMPHLIFNVELLDFTSRKHNMPTKSQGNILNSWILMIVRRD